MEKTKKSLDTLVPFLCTQHSKFHIHVPCCESIFLHCTEVTQSALLIKKSFILGTVIYYFIDTSSTSLLQFSLPKTLLPIQSKHRWSLLWDSKCSCRTSLNGEFLKTPPNKVKSSKAPYTPCVAIFQWENSLVITT